MASVPPAVDLLEASTVHRWNRFRRRDSGLVGAPLDAERVLDLSRNDSGTACFTANAPAFVSNLHPRFRPPHLDAAIEGSADSSPRSNLRATSTASTRTIVAANDTS
jgi:hypothetical protein